VLRICPHPYEPEQLNKDKPQTCKAAECGSGTDELEGVEYEYYDSDDSGSTESSDTTDATDADGGGERRCQRHGESSFLSYSS
jgi:hypothetical protein